MPDATVRKIQVLISSTLADLAQYRQEASRIIESVAAEKEKRVQLVEVSMEKETQSGDREFVVAVSKGWVEESDWVVVIVGWNYGTISDEEGASGLSVTEWEYRHALALRKKTFVFIAGSPGTANQYRVSDEEKEDLKDWIPRQTKEQDAKLRNFKEYIGRQHAEMFSNLAKFRERLKRTLTDAIDDLPPDVQPGSALAELILAVTPAIRDCIRQVTLIANCKEIHDKLHELRQQVIRRLREEVLPSWREEGTLSASKERLINGRLNTASSQLGAIGQTKHLVTSDHQDLLRSVDHLLSLRPFWDVESDSRPSMETFAEAVDDFAVAVQDAFSEVDRSMAGEERALDELHAALLEAVSEARRQRQLRPTDDQQLDDELRKVGANKSRLASALATHHAWQEAHNELEKLHAFRETNRFEKELRRFSRTGVATLLDLVERELSTASSDSTGVTGPPGGPDAAVGRHGGPDSHSNVSDAHAADLGGLREQLEALRQGKGVEAFDLMRVHFDDAFYWIDKRTLRDVERSRQRVIAFEKLLEVLARG
jgi:hypothetical protein